jgi:hypothetical protein
MIVAKPAHHPMAPVGETAGFVLLAMAEALARGAANFLSTYCRLPGRRE